MYAGRFKFLKIFHHDDFEKSLSKAVEAFKVWASRAIPAGRKFSKGVLRSKKCLRHVNKVSKPIQMTLRPFSKFSSFFFFFFSFSFFFFFFFRTLTAVLEEDEAASPQRPKGRSQLNPSRFTKLFKTMPKLF